MAQPTLMVFAGPNGAGKTTLARYVLDGDIPNVNPDNIAEELRKQSPNLDEENILNRAGRESVAQRQECLKNGKDFVIETTLSGNHTNLFKAAKEHGFRIHLVFVGIDSKEMSLLRVRVRHQEKGHDVPDDAIARRYNRVFENYREVAPLCDEIHVFDNTYGKYETVLNKKDGKTLFRSLSVPAYMKAYV